MEKTRTMLLDSELSEEFWGEIIMTAVYLKNLTSTNERGPVTPAEVWNNRKPTVSYFKVFGCSVYYFVPKVNRNKLKPTVRKGIFIGYSEGDRSYRVYDPILKKIVATRNAKFNEEEKGAKLILEGSKNTRQLSRYDMLEDIERNRREEADDERIEGNQQRKGTPEEDKTSSEQNTKRGRGRPKRQEVNQENKEKSADLEREKQERGPRRSIRQNKK